MRTVRFALVRSLKDGLSPRFQQPHFARTLSTEAIPKGDTEEEKPLSHLLQSVNDYERSIFSGSPKTDSFFQKFDRIGKGRDSFGSNWTGGSRGGFPSGLDGIDESLSSLQDGIDGKLEKAATNFKFDNGVDGSSSRDRSLREGVNYGTMDRRPRERFSRPRISREFKPTTEEVLKNADFRNVRFLANFLTESGIMIKRSQTRISAKAQRRVAREIKTARSFGLLPFTTMGTRAFAFGKSMEDRDDDYEYESLEGGNMMPMPDTLD